MATYFPANALIVDSVTKTVGAAGDFVTPQGAIDWFKHKLVVGACVIDADAGSYDEALDFSDIFTAAGGSLTLRGDTRVLAGITYVDTSATATDAMNRRNLANGGDGVCTLSTNPARDQITVAGSIANPDFNADGWGNGDEVIVFADDGNIYERTVNSINPGGAGNHVIELTVALPAGATLGNDGTAVGLKPDRQIERTAAGPCIAINNCLGVNLDGWFLDTASGGSCHGISLTGVTHCEGENILTFVEDYGAYVGSGANLETTDGATSFWNGSVGAVVVTGRANFRYVVAVGCTSIGFRATGFGYINARYALATEITNEAFRADVMSNLYGRQCIARQSGTGYYAESNSYLDATTTNASNNGNVVDYNPLPGVIPGYGNGNGDANIYAS